MSDDEFDEESFACYENELYGINDFSDSEVDSEVEDALYRSFHYSYSLPDDQNEGDIVEDKSPDKYVEASASDVINISDDGSDINIGDVGNHGDGYHGKSTVPDKEKNEQIPENWDLIDRDLEDGSDGRGGSSRYYFTPGSNSHKRCRNCNEKGHLAKNCPLPRKFSCILCGLHGHSKIKCPNQLCFNCSQPGHRLAECKQIRVRWTDQCRRCFQPGHHSISCPDLWRQYHRTTVEGVPPVRPENSKKSTKTVYCYNCSASGHYGYECTEERSSDSISFSTVQYVVQYDKYNRLCHSSRRISEHANREAFSSRMHDQKRNKKKRTSDHYKEAVNTHNYQAQTPHEQKKNKDNQYTKSRKRSHDQEMIDYSRTPGLYKETLNTPDFHTQTPLDQKQKDHRNRDNQSTNSRKRTHDQEMIDYSRTPKNNKRLSEPSDFVTFGNDDLTGDMETFSQGIKNKKRRRKKNRKTNTDSPFLVTLNQQSDTHGETSLERTVEINEAQQSDTLMRIVDDWEEMNGSTTKKSKKTPKEKSKKNKNSKLPELDGHVNRLLGMDITPKYNVATPTNNNKKSKKKNMKSNRGFWSKYYTL